MFHYTQVGHQPVQNVMTLPTVFLSASATYLAMSSSSLAQCITSCWRRIVSSRLQWLLPDAFTAL